MIITTYMHSWENQLIHKNKAQTKAYTFPKPNLGNRHQANFRQCCVQKSTGSPCLLWPDPSCAKVTVYVMAWHVPECSLRNADEASDGSGQSVPPSRWGSPDAYRRLTAWSGEEPVSAVSTYSSRRDNEWCASTWRVQTWAGPPKPSSPPNALQSETTG